MFYVLHVWLWRTALSIGHWEEAAAVSVLWKRSHHTSRSESFQHRSCPCAAESSAEDSGKTPAELTVFIQKPHSFIFSLKSDQHAPVCRPLIGWASSQRPPARPGDLPRCCCISPSYRSLPPACYARYEPPPTGSSIGLWRHSETYSLHHTPPLSINV